MESIFLLKKDGDCLGEIDRDKDIEENILVKVFIHHFSSPEEKAEKEKELHGLKQGMQSHENNDLFWQDVEEFKKLGYLPYVFGGRKKDIARLLLTLPLDGAERVEFFGKLDGVPEEKTETLYNSLLEDSKNTIHFR